jgi:hypothetical protein
MLMNTASSRYLCLESQNFFYLPAVCDNRNIYVGKGWMPSPSRKAEPKMRGGCRRTDRGKKRNLEILEKLDEIAEEIKKILFISDLSMSCDFLRNSR